MSPRSMSRDLNIRLSSPDDADTIFELIVLLAEYEREPDAVVSSPDRLRAQQSASAAVLEAEVTTVRRIARGRPPPRRSLLRRLMPGSSRQREIVTAVRSDLSEQAAREAGSGASRSGCVIA